MRFHADAVNAVALLRDGRAVTAGADGRIAIWRTGAQQPETVLEGHSAPIVALAVSPDGAWLASAAWDNTVRLWPLAGGSPRVLEGHTQNVNGVAFTPDGKAVVSAAYDLTLRIWPLDGAAATIVTLPAPLSAVAVAPDGEIVAAGANGMLYFLDRDGKQTGELQASPTPVISLAISGDGALIAAAGIRGSVAVIERKDAQARAHAGRSGPAGVVGGLLAGQSHHAHRRHRPHGAPLGRGDRRAHRRGRDGRAGGPARRLRGRSRRGGVPRLRRVPHALARRRQSRRPDARRHLRAQDRERSPATISPMR